VPTIFLEEKSDDNPQDANGTETITVNGIELNPQQLMQILASWFKQIMLCNPITTTFCFV